jgi:hypothetical protein
MARVKQQAARLRWAVLQLLAALEQAIAQIEEPR